MNASPQTSRTSPDMAHYSTAVAAVYEAVPNFSEGRDRAVIGALAAGEDLLDVHADAAHHRCVVTLAACDPACLVDALFRRVALAVEHIDLRRHTGLHPRVGAADVLPIVPLGDAAMAEAVAAAGALAERIWRELRVPVCFYGAMAGGRRLADIRRGGVAPDLGDQAHPTAGICSVGARPPLVACNIAFPLPRLRVREVAAGMRQLPGVQALTFPLPDGRVQLSMNLVRPWEIGVGSAYREATRLAGVEGEPELVGLCPAIAAGPGCDGRLLEARLAGQAARRAATLATTQGGDELSRLAGRLAAEAEALAALEAGQEAALGGAERAAALRRILDAAGLRDGCTPLLLRVAAEGLRAAVTSSTETRFARRVGLLDRWLAEAS